MSKLSTETIKKSIPEWVASNGDALCFLSPFGRMELQDVGQWKRTRKVHENGKVVREFRFRDLAMLTVMSDPNDEKILSFLFEEPEAPPPPERFAETEKWYVERSGTLYHVWYSIKDTFSHIAVLSGDEWHVLETPDMTLTDAEVHSGTKVHLVEVWGEDAKAALTVINPESVRERLEDMLNHGKLVPTNPVPQPGNQGGAGVAVKVSMPVASGPVMPPSSDPDACTCGACEECDGRVPAGPVNYADFVFLIETNGGSATTDTVFYITRKTFFDKYKHIYDQHIELPVPEFDEVMESGYMYLGKGGMRVAKIKLIAMGMQEVTMP